MLSSSKIRKRGGSSSSSGGSSSFRHMRLKKGVHVRRKGGATTPAPVWKLSSRSPPSGEWYDVAAEGMSSSLSARKLVSALWQLDNEPPSRTVSRRSDETVISHQNLQKIPRSDKKWCSNKQILYRSSDFKSNSSGLEAICTAHAMKKKTAAVQLNELRDTVVAAKELSKMLLNIWSIREDDPSLSSLASALHSELSVGPAQLRLVAKEVAEMERLMEERSVALRDEKHRRRRTERMLGKTEALLARATEELRREKRRRERAERTCDELARVAGDYNAELEELRVEAVKAQEEMETERGMLQLVDEWREERVQMKLLDARLHLEEKSAAIDELWSELERKQTPSNATGGDVGGVDQGSESCREGEIGEAEDRMMHEDAERCELVRLLREHLLAGRCIVNKDGNGDEEEGGDPRTH